MARQSPTRWTIQQREFALDLYRNGMPPTKVKEATGVPVATLQNWRKKAGIAADRTARATPRSHPKMYDVIVGLSRKGFSPRQIAKIIDRSDSTVNYYLRRAGVQRSPSEALKLAYAMGRRNTKPRPKTALERQKP